MMQFVSESILLNQPPVKAIRLLRERRGWNLDGMEETVINFALPLSPSPPPSLYSYRKTFSSLSLSCASCSCTALPAY